MTNIARLMSPSNPTASQDSLLTPSLSTTATPSPSTLPAMSSAPVKSPTSASTTYRFQSFDPANPSAFDLSYPAAYDQLRKLLRSDLNAVAKWHKVKCKGTNDELATETLHTHPVIKKC